MTPLTAARQEPATLAAQRRTAVLVRLDITRPRTTESLLASLCRDLGTTWQVGLDAVLRQLESDGLVTRGPQGWVRVRPRVDEWLATLGPDIRAELSQHDIAALQHVVGS